MEAEFLARVQFAFTISFHIIFPAFTIGLASWLAVLEARWLKTGKVVYRELYQFWVKVFAVSFGMGVVSGIVMSYQFGTNWSGFSAFAGPVMGPMIGYEVLTAFFLEATFLGIMLFGWDRVPRKVHFLATVLVAVGTLLSSFWILAANSWMQTPAGFEVVDGVAHPTDWIAAIFNPSFPSRLVHMVFGAYLTTAFVIGGVGAFYLLRRKAEDHAKVMVSMALWLIAILAPLQIIAGDVVGLKIHEEQPEKLAAMEGHWETRAGQPFHLFAVPDSEDERNSFAISIPYASSLIVGHSPTAELKGLKAFPEDRRPPVALTFWSFRIMVGLGFIMLGIGIYSLWLRYKRRLYTASRFHRVCVAAAPAGFLATLTGWFTAEIGRQPWMIYGEMRLAEALSPVSAGGVLATLLIFLVTYGVVFVAGIYYILKLFQAGPETAGAAGPHGGHAGRPMAAAEEPIEPGA